MHSIIIFSNRLNKSLWRNKSLSLSEFVSYFFKRISPGFLNALITILFRAKPRNRTLIPYLKGFAIGLFVNCTSELRVRVVAQIDTLVDESVPVDIEHQTERVPRFCEFVCDLPIAAVGGRICVPAGGMAARPISCLFGIDVANGHFKHFACVVWCAAHACEIPCWAEILCAHAGVGFEAACGENDGFGFEDCVLAFVFDYDASDSA